MILTETLKKRLKNEVTLVKDVYTYLNDEPLSDIIEYPIIIIYPGAENVTANVGIMDIIQDYSNEYLVDIYYINDEEQLIAIRSQIESAIIAWKPDDDHSPFEFNGGGFVNVSGKVYNWQDSYITRRYRAFHKQTI